MYAIVKIGKSQYKVAEGDTIAVDRLAAEAGKDVTLDEVLLVGEGKDVQVGQPLVKGAKVQAAVVGHAQGAKVTTLRTKRRNQQQRRSATRPQLTTLNIKKIAA